MNLTRDILDAAEHVARHTASVAMTTFVRWGSVESTSPVTVLFDGDTTAVPVQQRASSYTPAVDDRVVLLRLGARWVIVAGVVAT